MEYRKNNKISVTPSLLGFGCMRLPLNSAGKIDYVKTEKMIDLAIKGGVTYFDTAYPYHDGESEVVVGQILKKYPRESYTITTKLPVWLVHQKADIIRIFNEQLDKLGVSYLDFYLLHAIDKARYLHIKNLGGLELLMELKREGKIKNLGFSFHGSYQDFEDIVEDSLGKIDIVQIQLNYIDVDIQQGLKGYHLLEKHDLPVLIMEPVKGGSLANPPLELTTELRTLHPNWSMPSWAFRYLMQYPNIICILSGMSTIAQVQDNLQTFNSKDKYTQQEELLIQKLKDSLNKRIYVGCTNCQYCLPCPYGVKINEIFKLYNEMHMYNRFTFWDKKRLIEHFNLKNCVACGLCQTKCPQSIKIPTRIKEITENIEKI